MRAHSKNWIDANGAGEIRISDLSHGYRHILRTQRRLCLQAGCDQFQGAEGGGLSQLDVFLGHVTAQCQLRTCVGIGRLPLGDLFVG